MSTLAAIISSVTQGGNYFKLVTKCHNDLLYFYCSLFFFSLSMIFTPTVDLCYCDPLLLVSASHCFLASQFVLNTVG